MENRWKPFTDEEIVTLIEACRDLIGSKDREPELSALLLQLRAEHYEREFPGWNDGEANNANVADESREAVSRRTI